jgi:phosphatidylserine/phosphatidylglycerophosphate/cardiolipin synthase-like enzyme
VAEYQEKLRKDVAETKAREVEAREAAKPKVRTPGELKVKPSAALVQPVPVYEHPRLMREAMRSAKERLIIISPWIRAAVVDDAFISELKALLKRKVDVHIGYGLGSADSAGPKDIKALNRLKGLTSNHQNFHLVHLGDTHAKVLIVDVSQLVITSFNWLSFAGDPGRTFREEWGMMTTEETVIAQYAAEILRRLTTPK